jgi:hypothetical protein
MEIGTKMALIRDKVIRWTLSEEVMKFGNMECKEIAIPFLGMACCKPASLGNEGLKLFFIEQLLPTRIGMRIALAVPAIRGW